MLREVAFPNDWQLRLAMSDKAADRMAAYRCGLGNVQVAYSRMFDGLIDFDDDENEVDYLNLDPDDWEKNDFTPDIEKVLEENGYRLTSECETDGDILSFTCVKDA